jgi:hypothetical protein
MMSSFPSPASDPEAQVDYILSSSSYPLAYSFLLSEQGKSPAGARLLAKLVDACVAQADREATRTLIALLSLGPQPFQSLQKHTARLSAWIENQHSESAALFRALLPGFAGLQKTKQAFGEAFSSALDLGMQSLESSNLLALESACTTLKGLLQGRGRRAGDKIEVPVSRAMALVKKAVSRSAYGQVTSTHALELLRVLLETGQMQMLPWAWPICDVLEAALRVSEPWVGTRVLAYDVTAAAATVLRVGVAQRLFRAVLQASAWDLRSMLGAESGSNSNVAVPVLVVTSKTKPKQGQARVDTVALASPAAEAGQTFGRDVRQDLHTIRAAVACLRAMEKCAARAGRFVSDSHREEAEDLVLRCMAQHGPTSATTLLSSSSELRVAFVQLLQAQCDVSERSDVLRQAAGLMRDSYSIDTDAAVCDCALRALARLDVVFKARGALMAKSAMPSVSEPVAKVARLLRHAPVAHETEEVDEAEDAEEEPASNSVGAGAAAPALAVTSTATTTTTTRVSTAAANHEDEEDDGIPDIV